MPLAQLGQYGNGGVCKKRKRRYTRAHEVEQLAVRKYKNNGKGMSFNDLLTSGLAMHKEQAQITLKHCLEKQVLFTISNHKPQHYYPSCLKSEISKDKMSKNIQVKSTGVGLPSMPLFSSNADDESYDNLSVIARISIRNCQNIALDPKVSAKDRIEAERLKLETSIALVKLEVEGTTITQVNQYDGHEDKDNGGNNLNLIEN